MRELSPETLELVAERFKVLSVPTRLRLLQALRGGERSVSELVERTGSAQANVSRHLGILRRHGMVERRKDGVSVLYRVADPLIFELCELVCDRLEAELRERREVLGS